jgi:hypothetical protein
MLYRCTNPKQVRWKDYGGANPPVKICKRWLGVHGFKNFLHDVGERPQGTTLSRFADMGDYKLGNCAWHTWKQQGEERRKKARAV